MLIRVAILAILTIGNFVNYSHCAISTNASSSKDGVFYFREKDEFAEFPEISYEEELNIFCYNGTPLSIIHFWSSVEMKLKIDSESYHLYVGNNVSSVQAMYNDHMSSWFYQVLPSKSQNIKVGVFDPTCVGVLSREAYKMSLVIKRVDYVYVLMFLIGIALFYSAKDLCRNVFFHYTTGVGMGIFLSLIVITYFVQKRFKFWIGWAIASYSLATYLITSVWYNIKIYLLDHYLYVLGYLVVTGAVSFGVCYRMGPVENPRSINLIQWTMQAFALMLVFCSSYHQAASLTVVLSMLLWEATPAKWKTKMQVQYHLKIVKPKAKLLTEQEYFDQSQVETAKALKELREFCKSPKCDPWKVTSRLKSPTRFAEFVAGGPHLTQDEILNYSHEEFDEDEVDHAAGNSNLLTDDNSSDDDDLIDLESPYD